MFFFLYSFDGRRRWKGSKESLENKILLHKYKREMKGAIREIRRDNQFLAKQQLEEQLERYDSLISSLYNIYNLFNHLVDVMVVCH